MKMYNHSTKLSYTNSKPTIKNKPAYKKNLQRNRIQNKRISNQEPTWTVVLRKVLKMKKNPAVVA